MSWEVVLQSVTAGFAMIGAWFIYDLIKEFKSFKESTRTDVGSLKAQRDKFEYIIRQAELTIGLRVNDLQRIQNEFSTQLKAASHDFKMETQNLDKFMVKSLEVVNLLNERVKRVEADSKDIKIKLGELIIFKTNKG